MRVSSHGNVCYILLYKLLQPSLLIVDMTRLTDLDVDRFSRKYWPRFREKFFANGVENFRENCSKIAKFFFENERKMSEIRVSRFSLETLVPRYRGGTLYAPQRSHLPTQHHLERLLIRKWTVLCLIKTETVWIPRSHPNGFKFYFLFASNFFFAPGHTTRW